MKRFIGMGLVALGLVACDNETNPFMVTNDGETEEVDTETPSTRNNRFLFDPANGLTMNNVAYDEANDELIINNLPFDGPDGRYERDSDMGGTGGRMRNSYRSVQTPTTGRVQHYAVFIRSDELEATAALGEWQEYGYGGANLKRESFSLPDDGGEYVYVGDYAGVRKRNDGGEIELVSGNARLLLDELDFDPDGTVKGAIVGNITNRTRAGKTNLPTVYLKTLRFASEDLTFEDGNAGTEFENNLRDSGKYTGMIAGADGSELGAMLVIEGTAEIQRVQYEVLTWRHEEEVTTIDPITGLAITRTIVTRGVERGLTNENRDAVTAQVDAGQDVPLLTANTADIPTGAEITRTVESTVISSDASAREIGVAVTERLPTQ